MMCNHRSAIISLACAPAGKEKCGCHCGKASKTEWGTIATSENALGCLARNTVADFAPKGQAHCRRNFGARERTRTSTTLRSLAPEASASASSATRARVKKVGSGRNQPHEAFSILPGGQFFVNAGKVALCRWSYAAQF